MKIKSGFFKEGREFSVEVDASEIFTTLPPPSAIDGWLKVAKVLSATADTMVVDYMESEELISHEYAQQRRKEILTRART